VGERVARAFQYEKGQSRIGAVAVGRAAALPRELAAVLPRPGDDADAHHEQRRDGAVPWYQGIELFVGARRFGKEAYLLNYNGDGHNPRKRANQLDVDRRMQQFFAHHLKGEPAPAWMREGVPYARKGRDQLAPAATVAGGEAGAPNAPAAGGPPAAPSGAPGGGAPGGSRGAGAGTP
jgi:hypothetical protein